VDISLGVAVLSFACCVVNGCCGANYPNLVCDYNGQHYVYSTLTYIQSNYGHLAGFRGVSRRYDDFEEDT